MTQPQIALAFSAVEYGNFLVIPDTQIPFEHEKALHFCEYLFRHFKIPKENVLHCGDEVDSLHGSSYPKDPDGIYSATEELRVTRDKIKEWSDVFPLMRLAVSNHGVRWVKKASAAEIPSQLLRSYKEIIGAPEGWRWKDSWTIETKHPFLIKHGVDLSGKTPYRKSAELSPISTIFGHLHSSQGMCRVVTNEKNVWSMNAGCLIDVEAYAFKYEKNHTFKPCLGAAVIFQEGNTPVWFPLK